MRNDKEINSNLINEKLFCRGYIFSEKDINSPLFSDWSCREFGKGKLFLHGKTDCCFDFNGNLQYALIGHAYDPFGMEYEEKNLLKKISRVTDISQVINELNNWTGLFTLIVFWDGCYYIFGDCCCMQSAYYGIIENGLVLSSHAQLIGDIFGLKENGYVSKMKKYRFWQKYGLFLPGDTSQFDSVKRVVPNTFVKVMNGDVKIVRFFPMKENEVCKTEEEYQKTIENIGNILHNNLRLISEKWKKPAISMTGGMDSKTTVACTNGLYDKFKYFSYVSMAGEKPDAEAAEKIAEAIGVKHVTYDIPESDDAFGNIKELKNVIERNYGNIGKANANDVRKRAFFMDTEDFDVEVKSWVSEIGRANYYKKFGLKKMPYRLSPRQMTSMYKFFLYNRSSAYKTSRIFKEYIRKTNFNEIFNYDSSDMYLWEFRYGAWGGLVLSSEHRVSFEITIPFNNRILMNEFLKLPLDKRIKDIPHYDIIKSRNRLIDDLGITVTNWNETEKRMHREKLYYKINSHLPF